MPRLWPLWGQAAITDAVVAKNIPPEKLAVISGIGCSSRIGGYFYAYGAHTTHGRALPYAQGVNLLPRFRSYRILR